VGGEYSGYMGGGQAVMHDAKTKVNYGASSPRKDGAAIPEPDPYWGGAPSGGRLDEERGKLRIGVNRRACS
jgi:hypothetical protein